MKSDTLILLPFGTVVYQYMLNGFLVLGTVGIVTLRIIKFSICVLFVLLTRGALADEVLDEARELLGRQQAGAAYDLLSPLEGDRSGDPDFDYLLGIAALDAGLATQAIFALERVLAVDPTHDLARAAIAHAYLIVGERETARQEFETVQKVKDIPEAAQETFNKILALMDQARVEEDRTTISGYVDMSIGYDSNINSATDESQVPFPILAQFIPGTVLTLTGNTRERDHSFANLAAAVNVSHPVAEGWRLIGGARGYNRITAAPFSTRDAYAYAGTSAR